MARYLAAILLALAAASTLATVPDPAVDAAPGLCLLVRGTWA